MSADDYFAVEVDPGRQLVRLIRTARPMPDDVAEVKRVYTELAPRLSPYAGYRVLLDLRRVPIGRNDRAFEEQAIRAQAALTKAFTRSAVLVRSAAGKLQVRRMTGGSGHVFQDESEAILYLVGE